MNRKITITSSGYDPALGKLVRDPTLDDPIVVAGDASGSSARINPSAPGEMEHLPGALTRRKHMEEHILKRGHTAKVRNEENLAKMEEIRARLKMDKSEFSIALGYVTGGGYAASVRQGANLMQLLAAEGVEMRYAGKESRPVYYTLLAIHPDGKVESIPLSGAPQTANIMGHEYFLVPRK